MFTAKPKFHDMLQQEFTPAVENTEAYIEEVAGRCRDLLRQRFKQLEVASATILKAGAEDELEQAVDAAFERVEGIKQQFFEEFIRFDDDLSQFESQVFDLATDRTWEKLISAELDAEEATESRIDVVTEEVDGVQQSAESEITAFFNFLNNAKSRHPTYAKIQEQERMAELLKRELESRWLAATAKAENQAGRAKCDELLSEISQVIMILGKLHGLLLKAERDRSTPGHRPLVSQRKSEETHIDSSEVVRNSNRGSPQGCKEGLRPESDSTSTTRIPAQRAAPGKKVTPFGSGKLQIFEEDFYKYRSWFITWRKTATDEVDTQQSLVLGRLVRRRQEELRTWRAARGYIGQQPLLISEMFTAIVPKKVRRSPSKRKQNAEKFAPETMASKTRKIRGILDDLSKNPGHRQAPKYTGNLNRRVFLTAGRINPRAKK